MAGMYGCFKSRTSDSAAMASGPSDVMANQEPAEAAEECSGKKKSKFKTFKKFFARKKRKEPTAAGADAGLKASQSSDNVSKASENNTLTRSEKDKGSGSKISLGSKALSHDSVFVSDSSEANEALGASQDSIHGKVKSLQLQLKQAIKLGSPPSLMCVKRTEDAGAMSEDDGLPCSPPEYTTPHTTMSQAQRNSAISLEGTESDDDQLSCAASSRAVSPLVVPGDFSQPASPFGCLDNSAAKHKLGLRHKACHRRKPATRLELKAESDTVDGEILNTSITEASEEKEQLKTTEVVGADELKPKVEVEEEENKEEEEQPQHSRQSLLSDKEEKEEGEDESEAEQDVICGPDTSSPPELCPSEEEAPDAQPPPSSKPSSRASSLDSLGATPEPPAGPKEYLMDPPGVAYGAEENRAECDLVLRADEVQENREEESSFLQEVLSSLKTPLASSSLGMETEGVVLETEEESKNEEREDVKVGEGELVKDEEAQEDEPASSEAVPVESLPSEQTSEEKQEVTTLSTSTPSPEGAEEEEKVEDEDSSSSAAEEEEELMVEQFSPHGQKEEEEKEEAEDVQPEEQREMCTESTVSHAEEEREEEESEGEEEAVDLKREPEVGEEGSEEDEEVKERVDEAEKAIEEERDVAEEMTAELSDAAGEEGEIAMELQEVDEGVDVVVGDDTVSPSSHTHDDQIPAELPNQEFAVMQESQAASSQSFEEEREGGEETVEEDAEIDPTEHKADQEEDDEAKQPDEDESEQNVEQEGAETIHLDVKQVEKDQTEASEQAPVSSKPSSLSLIESHDETQSQDSGAITPSKTSTTTLHINLLSPSSEKAKSFFQQSPTAAHPKESEKASPAVTAAEQNTASTEEETADTIEEDKQSAVEEAAPPASVEETVNRPSKGADQSKVRFTIAPAWQRSISVEEAKESVTPPSSPPACVSSSSSAAAGPGGVQVEATTKKDPEVKAEPASPANAELVLSPGRGRNAGTTSPKPPSNAPLSPPAIKPPPSAAASTEVEGNPDNPFGVRLRKTSVLHRFSSEDENTEPPVEPTAQPTSGKVDSPQPVSVKPSISQPISNKPALPKKPDVHGDSAGKNKRVSDPAAARAVSAGSDSPSWISVAKQKQKIYKENSLEEITVKKEEQERKSSLPTYVSSAVSREHSNKAESAGKVSPLEVSKPPLSVEKEARRALSPPTPVPSQPPKSQSLPCPIPPKPQVPPATTKPLQPTAPQRSLSPPTPVPVPQKSPSCTSPSNLPKPAPPSKTPQPQNTTVTSPPFSSRTPPEKPQRGLPPPALPQDEPPWMALAKKKAKAWSEMPQIVQ